MKPYKKTFKHYLKILFKMDIRFTLIPSMDNKN